MSLQRNCKRSTSGLGPLLLLILYLSPLIACDITASAQQGNAAPNPLYRDPIHDGAADPTIIFNRAQNEWWMFYTSRRADMAIDDDKDVAWIHGTRIGIAVSADHGQHWKYKGTASIPYGKADYTHWAPDIVFWQGHYHMMLTVVPGTFHDWQGRRDIVHFTSPDLEHWTLVSALDLGSARVIDPTLFQMPSGVWRMWYKDELDQSYIHYADSKDLNAWTVHGRAIADRSSEGPKVFRWQGAYWLIVDAWKGLGVYRSIDLEHWIPQPDNILFIPGNTPTDRVEGHHCDVVVSGESAFIFYFTHQSGPDLDARLIHSEDRTVIHVAELEERAGIITVDRNAAVHVDLR